MPLKIYNAKSSSCLVNNDIKNQKSLFEITDCSGNKFMYVNKFTNVTRRVIESYLNEAKISPYFYINTSVIDNSEFIAWTINKLAKYNMPMYIETDRSLSEGILDSLSKNPFNIIQCNLSQISSAKEDYDTEEEYMRIQGLRVLPYKAKIHGLYVILNIDPIVPQVTQLKNILTLLNAEKNVCNHIILNFIKIPKIKGAKDSFVSYFDSVHNVTIDSDYFELKNNVWECAKWYKDLVIEDLRYLSKDIDISICGECKKCRGIKLNEAIRCENGGYKLNVPKYNKKR